jgi:alkanesulfonate monooxygenase SsuD/methylene tetrahydromethanopterin reductase-like flavin-dependent oxidoreductase (luciferase family)
MLSIAAREADIVSVNILTTADGQLDLASSSAAATDQKIAWVRQAAGDRFGSLELNILLLAVLITSDPHQALADWLAQWGMTLADISPVISVDELIASPHMLIGTQAEVIEKLQAQRERFGISYYTIFGEDQIDRFAPIVARLAGT